MSVVGEIQVDASLDASKYRKASKEIESEAKKTGAAVDAGIGGGSEKGAGRASEAMQKFGKIMGTAVVAGAAVATTAIAAISISSIKAYANLEQSLGGAEVVFAEFSDSVKKEARSSSQFMGTTMGQYLDTANKMGSLFQGSGLSVKKSMELSRDAMRRATDVATAMGISNEMALESIAGAAKGNFTMMDNLGVKMTATSIAAYALSKGITKSYESMTEAEKVGLAMQQFMEVTAKYAGNYSKENDTLSGSFQTLKGTWGNFLAGVEGSGETVAQSLSQMVKVLGRELPKVFGALVNNAKGMYNELRQSNPEFKKYSDIAESTFKLASDSVNSFIITVKALAPVIIGAGSAFVAYKGVIIAVNAVQKLQAIYAAATGTVYTLLNGQLMVVRTATVAQTVAQTALNTAMRLNPLALVAAAAIGIVTAYVAVVSQTDRTTSATDRLKAANNSLKSATDNLKIAEQSVTDARLARTGSDIAVQRAEERLSELKRGGTATALDLKEAEYNLAVAKDAAKAAAQRESTAIQDVTNKKNDELRQKDAVIAANNAVAASANNAATQYGGWASQMQNVINKKPLSDAGIKNTLSVPGNKRFDVPKFGNRASGGPVSANKPYFVGENKDGSLNKTSELFMPRTSGSIVNSSNLQKALAGGNGGGTIVENNIGTIVLGNDVDVDSFFNRLTRDTEIFEKGLTPKRNFA